MAKTIITKSMLHDSTGTPVFWCQKCWWNSVGINSHHRRNFKGEKKLLNDFQGHLSIESLFKCNFSYSYSCRAVPLRQLSFLLRLTAHQQTSGGRDSQPSGTDYRKCAPNVTHSKLGDRSFSVAGPRLWNDLPPRLRRPGLSFDTFKQSLKTYSFGDRSA